MSSTKNACRVGCRGGKVAHSAVWTFAAILEMTALTSPLLLIGIFNLFGFAFDRIEKIQVNE